MTTRRVPSERRAAALAEMSALLSSSLDYERTLPRLVRLAVPALGDLCAIDLLHDESGLHRVACAHVDAAREPLVHEIGTKHAGDSTGGQGVSAVIRTRRPVLVARATEADLRAAAQNAEQLALFRQLGPKSWIVTPLVAHDRVLGAMTLALTESGRRYGPMDLASATVVASHAATMIENARLYRDAQAARRAAEAANRTKDEFLSTLSHELRNPLNAVYGWATLIERGQLGEAQTRRAVQIIVRNVRAQIRLVDDLLDMSKIVNGRMRLAVQPVDLGELIDDALEAVRHAAEAKGIRLHSVLEAPGLLVSGDAGRLQQVVWNLLDNAVKFTPKDGRVQVQLQRVRSHVEIVVSDTGQGIAADVLPYVFDRLRQGESGSTRGQGGLGIGLALVRHFVELHGGSVYAESAGEEHGATFVVKLPLMLADLREGAIARPQGQTPDVTSLAGARIVVVDDDPIAVELIKEVLVRAGGEVIECRTPDEALREVAQRRPDVLVSDIEMPGQDGYSLIRKVRSLDPEHGGKMPAVALTAFGRPEDRIRSLKAGFNIHLTKPVDPAELTVIVASVIGRTG
ncbi:MAG: histidine kinase [Candidatus Rokuibacteriota bacterium]|nr:MAG: histidine kinase [Candidatus Rokubacteria bacterium]